MKCGMPETGDKGQRFEIRCKGIKSHEEESTFGWSGSMAGVMMFVGSINLHPSMHSPRVIDRTTGKDVDFICN